jgi:O-antigen/teichoic acid export membrane protein
LATIPDAVVDAAREPASGPAPALSARSLRRGGMLFGASHVLGMAMGFLSSVAMVRLAPRSEVASYLLILQAALAVALVFQLGLVEAALRFVPVSRGAGGEAATRALRRRLVGLQIAVWAVVAPPLVLAWPTIARRLDAPELAGAGAILVALAMMASLGRVIDAYLRAFRLYSVSATLTHAVPRGLVLAAFAALWIAGVRGVSWLVLIAVFVGSQLITDLAYAACLPATGRGEASEPRLAAPPPPVREIFSTTAAMGLRSAAAVLMVSSDLWILSWARSHEEVAVYGVVTRIIQVMGALPLVANFLIPQEFALLYADGKKAELERLARTAATAVALLSLGALAGIVLLGRPLIRIAFGAGYMSGWGILLILSAGTFWDAASGSAGYVLQMTGNHMTLLRLTAAGAAINAGLNFFLAPRLGGYGVAAATALTLVGLNLAMVRAARRRVGVRTFVYLEPAEWRRTFWLIATGGAKRLRST